MDNLVKVEGDLRIKDGSGMMIDFYEEEFILSDAIKNKEQALSLIRKGLITERLSRKVAGFKSVRTCQVISIEPTTEKAEQSDLEIILLKAIELGCVPENIDNYKRPDHKLKALQKAVELAIVRAQRTQKDNVQDMGVVN